MQRSKTHILKVMTLIFKIWIKNPGLRLCQLLGNCFPPGDNYYKTDDDLVERLTGVYVKGAKK